MIRLTNLADYAVVLLCQMVEEGNALVSAQQLAETTTLPVPTISKILGALGRANILVSQRGLKGGFQLARPATDITVADIVEAIDGPIALTNCVGGQPKDCAIEDACHQRSSWNVINNAIKDALHGVTLQDIASPVSPSALNIQVRSAISGTA